VALSRREIFDTHSDRLRIARCPVCRWAIEQDHEEALEMGPSSAPREDEQESAFVVGFALV
jgi:hypothetical protein